MISSLKQAYLYLIVATLALLSFSKAAEILFSILAIQSLILLAKKFFTPSSYQKLLAAPFALAFFIEYFPINSHKSHFSSHFNLSLWFITALFIATLFIKDQTEHES